MSKEYRLLQLTNAAIGPIPAATLLPVGIMTRRIVQEDACQNTFDVTTSVNNAIYINETGFYKITYTGYLTAAAAGDIIVELRINGVTMATATVTATAAGTVPVVFTFVTRVLSNCCGNVQNAPALVQLYNADTSVALSGGRSNLIIERVSTNC